MDKLNSNLPATNSDYGYVTDSSRLSSDFNSSLNTPSTAAFDSQSFFQNNTQSQYYSESQQWQEGSSNNSPVRESLDVRIENILRQHRVGLGSGFLSQMDFSDINSSFHMNDSPSYRKNNQKKIDESDAILGTPPSPFMSASDYVRWNKITKQIDSGLDPSEVNSEDEQSSDVKTRNKSDDDDDRMSLSSLSSGDNKLEDTTTTTATNPLYPSQHVQIMARLGLWKPGMGSSLSSFLQDKNSSVFNGSLLPQFMYQTFVPQSGSLGFFSGFSVPSALGVPADIFKQDSPSRDESSRSRLSKSNELLFNDLLTEALKKSIKELKEILTKDIYKKIVENFSYKMFDQWWEDSQRKSKSKENKPNDTLEGSEPIRRSDIHIPLFNPLFENSIHNRQETIVPNFEFGLSRGLRAAMPKLPSFKRKIVKVKSSPMRSFNDKLSDISDDSENEIRIHRKVRHRDRDDYERRRRRRHSVSSQSTRSSSPYSSSSSSSSSKSSDQGGSSSSSDYSDSDQSASESDSSSSSSSSQASSVSSKSSRSSRSSKLSRLSRHSRVSTTSSKKNVETFAKVQVDLSDISGDSDSTATADEYIPELDEEKSGLVASFGTGAMNHHQQQFEEKYDDVIGEIKKSEITSMLEYEATQALMALAGFATSSTFDGNQYSSANTAIRDKQAEADARDQAYKDSVNDAIVFEHSYCLPRQTEPQQPPSTVPQLQVETSKAKVGRPRKDKDNKENQEKKKRKKKELAVTDENAQPNVFAVASEWRKAKRKNIASDIDNLFLAQNDENKFVEPKAPEEPKITFPQRDVHAEMEILYEFLQNGIDAEDISYLKRSYDRLLQEETNLGWVNDIHWVDHPPTNVQLPKKKRRIDDSSARLHKTGCARSEGYYKLESHEKIKYWHVTSANGAGDDNDKSARDRQFATTQQLTREARSNQRRLLATVDSALTDLLKFNQLKVSD